MIKAVVVCDKEGNHLIHGASYESPPEMFRAITPVWTFDPSKETVHYVEIPVNILEDEDPMLGSIHFDLGTRQV